MLSPHVETQRTALRPAGAADGTAVYELLLRLGHHSLPTLDTFLGTFDENVDALFAIQSRHGGDTVGYGSLHQLDPAGHIQIGIFTDTARARFGVGGEAMMLLVNYAFATWEQVRKVYFLTTDASLDSFGAALANVPREATFPQHSYFAGQLWDIHWYAIYREQWETEGALILDRLVRGPSLVEPAG
ncbi:GNAT family N-acetyltransferase [Nonomuraea sp. 10N515B]|uniref:GNAT family N-acetyltransferase n=1 Tax=Nonomuraea sp. 10N515B TaxID=3457422 RepID=UPI003FCCC999